MSNLAWILLFAGLAILILLYFSSKPRKVRRTQQQRSDGYSHSHAGMGTAGPAPGMPSDGDPLMDTPHTDHYSRQDVSPQHVQRSDTLEDFGAVEFDSTDFERPGGGHGGGSVGGPKRAGDAQQSAAYATRHADQYATEHYAQNQPYVGGETPAPSAPPAPTSAAVTTTPTTLGGKLDALSARLTGRNKTANTDGSEAAGQAEQKVILLHVIAPEGQIIDGQLLLQVFEQRRYHFGELNIFHSLHQDQTVFSIAKMIEPGSFDVNDIASFETPGLVLILQLPGPVAADVAFEVLISEAQELGDALGCRVLDSKRSALSRQTTQHLREGVSDYMHRQKYLNKVTS